MFPSSHRSHNHCLSHMSAHQLTQQAPHLPAASAEWASPVRVPPKTVSWGGGCRVSQAERWQDENRRAAGLSLTPPHSLDPPWSPEGGKLRLWEDQVVDRGLTSQVFSSSGGMQLHGHDDKALRPFRK